MAQISKAAARRGKPSYFMAVLGVTIVLFFVGIFGWIFLSASSYIKALKEDVKVNVWLQKTIQQKDVDSLQAYIASQPYTKSIRYVDKEAAKKDFITSQGEKDFSDVLGNENPLPPSIEFHLKADYVNKDTLARIKNNLQQNVTVVESVTYPEAVIEKMGPTARFIMIGLIILAAIFSILSIILIDNTIRLAMYSNRFLIKTMQMVGATRSFISKPMNIRAIANGTLSALIAMALIFGLITVFENILPYLRELRDGKKLTLLFVMLLILGIGITLLSTYRSVSKYLRMKLDELY
jgi:cell division transport system permease protein